MSDEEYNYSDEEYNNYSDEEEKNYSEEYYGTLISEPGILDIDISKNIIIIQINTI